MSFPKEFAREMVVRATQVEEAVDYIVVQASNTIITEVVNATPVDTSLTLSNWKASLGSPASGVRSALFPGRYGDTAKSSGDAAIAAAKNSIKRRKVGQDVFIVNNFPVAAMLNNGLIRPRSSPKPSRTPYRRFAERAVLLGAVTVVLNARRIFK